MTDDEKAAKDKELRLMRSYAVQMSEIACRMLSDRGFIETAAIVDKNGPDYMTHLKHAEQVSAHYATHLDDLARNIKAHGIDFGHWDNEGLEAVTCSMRAMRTLIGQIGEDLGRIGIERVAAGMGRPLAKTLAGLIGLVDEDDEDDDTIKH